MTELLMRRVLRTQRQNLTQHSHTVVNEPNLAPFMMVPAHRNFSKPQSGALGKKKQLHVKAKADGLRRLNNRSACLHSKSFETTLRIPERKTGCHPHHQVENAAPLLAPPRLPVSDKFAIERARAKGDIHFAARDR